MNLIRITSYNVCYTKLLRFGAKPDLKPWKTFLNKYKNPKHEVTIALVGKYVELKDAYKSINEAFVHAGAANETKVNINYVHSEEVNESTYVNLLKDADGIIVTPGFGHRGIAGKVLAAQYARENNVPYFGICLGMQIAVVITSYSIHYTKLYDPVSESRSYNNSVSILK